MQEAAAFAAQPIYNKKIGRFRGRNIDPARVVGGVAFGGFLEVPRGRSREWPPCFCFRAERY